MPCEASPRWMGSGRWPVAMDIVVVGNAKEDASQVAKAESEGDI